MAYYYRGRSGDPFVDATIHADADCCPDPTRPIADATVDALDNPDLCPECADPVETCEVVKADGEVCGRELPCRFHSD